MFFGGYSLENPQNNAGNIHDMQKARCLKFLNVSTTQKEGFFSVCENTGEICSAISQEHQNCNL